MTGVVPTKKGRKKGTEAEPVQRAEVAVPFPVKLPGRNAKTATISPYYVTEPHRQSHEGGVRASFRFGEVFDFDD